MNMFDVLAELVETTQTLIDNGWRFTVHPGDYGTKKIVATKGDKSRYGYESESVEGFLESLCQEEREEYTTKLMAWFKTGSVCPVCKKAPPLNTYECKDCGWKL